MPSEATEFGAHDRPEFSREIGDASLDFCFSIGKRAWGNPFTLTLAAVESRRDADLRKSTLAVLTQTMGLAPVVSSSHK
jgi:hypothetical protein